MAAYWILLSLLVLCALSGAVVWQQWQRKDRPVDDARAYAHAVTAGLVLLALLLTLDHHAPSDKPVLLGIFFSIATGMLMFLQRQRQQRRSSILLALHLVATACAVLATGAKLV